MIYTVMAIFFMFGMACGFGFLLTLIVLLGDYYQQKTVDTQLKHMAIGWGSLAAGLFLIFWILSLIGGIPLV